MKTIEMTAKKMIRSLKECAEFHGVGDSEIRILFASDDINGLDELFGDGGEVRCEQFADLAWDYALQFGPFDSNDFNEARWHAIQLAMKNY